MKITIIMPVYNGEENLKRSLDSIVNQTMGIENLQVIIVNDASTDNSVNIINKYIEKYPSIQLINLEENIGAAYGPKNIGLKYVKCDYIMFLDADDSYELDACETLYNKITETDVDIVYGRYKRIFNIDQSKLVQKSHSPFKDTLDEYSDDILDNPNLSKFTGFLWKHIFCRLIYGKNLNNPKTSDGSFNDIYLKKLEDNINILRSLPSFWTKIYRNELILNNNIEFPPVISGEDLNFLMEAYFKADGIICLNNTFIYNYDMGDNESSITKNITYKLVLDSLKAYKLCSTLCNQNNFKHSDIILNPFLLNWISLYKKSNLNEKEKNTLLKEIKSFKKEYISGLIGKVILNIMILMLKL